MVSWELVLSRVGNFAIDLPDADVLIVGQIWVGGAQRLGRILRLNQMVVLPDSIP